MVGNGADIVNEVKQEKFKSFEVYRFGKWDLRPSVMDIIDGDLFRAFDDTGELIANPVTGNYDVYLATGNPIKGDTKATDCVPTHPTPINGFETPLEQSKREAQS